MEELVSQQEVQARLVKWIIPANLRQERSRLFLAVPEEAVV